jgi:hypothetical protein
MQKETFENMLLQNEHDHHVSTALVRNLSSFSFSYLTRNIAACYGIGKYEDDDPQNPGSLFIVQELIKGGNLLHKVYKQVGFKCG